MTARVRSVDDYAADSRITHEYDQPVSYVTMAVPSPHLDGATLGLARVHRDAAVIGTALAEVAADGGTAPATVTPTPVYDPARTRVRA
jgi:glycine cleavage system aminomethyltransferase T